MPRKVTSEQRLPLIVTALLLHMLPFASRPALIGGDEPHYALMAHSVAVDGDFELRDDYAAVRGGAPFAGRKRAGQSLDEHIRSVNGHEIFSHPVGLPVLIAPLIAVQQAIAPGSAPDLLLGLSTLAVTFAALLCGWSLLRRYVADHRAAAVAAFGVYFSSPLWFYSRTFFTEPYTWSFAVIALWCLAERRVVPASLLLGLTLAMKETALLLVLPIIAATAFTLGIRSALVLMMGPVLYAGLFVWKNLVLAGTPFSTFQSFSVGQPLAGAAGLLFDGTHGMLWFAPLLFVGLIGAAVPPRHRANMIILICGAAAFLAYFVVSAAWVDWRGGSSYGTRLLLPVFPLLALPVARLYMRSGNARVLLAVTFSAGFVVNWCAAVNPFTAFWGISAGELVRTNAVDAAAGVIVATLMMIGFRRWLPGPAETGVGR